MTKFYHGERIAVGLIAAMTVLFCLFWFWPGAKPIMPPSIHIGYLPIYVDLPLFVAAEKGYFHEEGVNVELHRFASSPEIGTALLTGNVDVGASTAYSVVLGYESREPGSLKVFLVDSENPVGYLSSFVALPKSGIKEVRDLTGKTIGCFPGPTSIVFSKLALQSKGIDPKKVSFLEIEVSSHIDALNTGRVDALFTYEPTATQAEIELGATKILPAAVESTVINPWQAGVWVASRQAMLRKEKEIAKVIRALYRAVDYITAHPTEAKTHLTKYTSVREDVALRTPNIPFAKLGEVDMVAFQKHADILHTAGIISKSIDTKDILLNMSTIDSR